MTKQVLKILIALTIFSNLISCSSDARRTSHEVPQNEGGIVGTGNSSNCDKEINRNKSKCNNKTF